MKQTIAILFLAMLLAAPIFAQDSEQAKGVPAKHDWVNQKLAAMSLDEKIGQLMMIRAHSNLGPDHIKKVKNLIKNHHVGALCFFQGTPMKQAQLTNTYQALAKTPLLIAIDGEWGLGMRFKRDIVNYPRQLTLGAIRNNNLIFDLGKQVGYDLKRIGIHLNFAPVVDVNNNKDNPVINNRSFGENKENVAAKSIEYMRGMQAGGILTCAKHFPGHGDTNLDSHYALPRLDFDARRLDSLELYPFRQMIAQDVESIMVAHLEVPSIDPRPNRPTSLSENAIKGLLRGKMGYDGLVITDGMEMEGVTKHFPPGVAEAEAIQAGNDILCLPRNVVSAKKAIKKYIKEGKISMDQIDQSVRRILGQKYKLGLYHSPRVVLNELHADLVNNRSLALKAKLMEQSITLAADSTSKIPFQAIADKRFASLMIGAKSKTAFQARIDSYVNAKHFQAPKEINASITKKLLKDLESYDEVIVGLQKLSKYSKKRFGLTPTMLQFLRILKSKTKVTLVVFGSPYSLSFLEDFETIVMAYTDDKMMQDRAAQALFGAFNIQGKMPVSASSSFPYGHGLQRASLQRFGYGYPEEVGMLSDSLAMIEEIVDEMIRKKAAPGCQILVAKDGKVVYHHAFGTKDYKKNNKVALDDLYDIASITKIAATTISIMRLQDMGMLNIDASMSPFYPEVDTTNKANKSLRDMMAHHAGLKPWIPFYKATINPKSKRKKTLAKYYARTANDKFDVEVANNLYMRKDYVDTVWHKILTSDLRKNNNYRYSDLGFYFMTRAVESASKLKLDEFCKTQFYHPLGLRHTDFNPRKTYSLQQIVPSERDNYFRNQTIHGHVHDMGAAMLGGVAGHAGLFSNSHDLGIIMQMLLNGGYYGGISFLEPSTIVEYTTRYRNSTRRGIGFDMKQLNKKKHKNMCEEASAETFGHLGFTGTCAFVDPKHNLVYIMLSNRTYPSMENNKFGRKNYRPRIQSVLYSALASRQVVPEQGLLFNKEKG